MKQVRRTTGFREVHSRPPGTTAGSVVDLHHFPDGSWPGSTQSDNRRSVVPTVRSEILPIILVIHRKMYPTADSSNHPMDTAADSQVSWIAKSSSAVRALLSNDDGVVLRSMIRRTRGVRSASKGTLYGRISRKLSAVSATNHITLLDLHQTPPEGHRLFAVSYLDSTRSQEVRCEPTLLLEERPSITALSTRNCHLSRRPALRLMTFAFLSSSWMSSL
jgi:hypothetical protein